MASEKTSSTGNQPKKDEAKSFSQKTSGTGKSGGDQSKSSGSHGSTGGEKKTTP